MNKIKTTFACANCGAYSNKWAGQCADCGQWNTLTEVIATKSTKKSIGGFMQANKTQIIDLIDVPTAATIRHASGLDELDRVLGGGLVPGSVVLIGGDPGIGKSTILLQSLAYLSQNFPVLYVTGEESLQQVRLRAERLGVGNSKVKLLAETQIEAIITMANQEEPKVIVLDSIQTMYTELFQSAPGSISQIRESTAQLVNYAKKTGIILFLIGHVTKEGSLAGPRILEHMVDTVLYFESDTDSRYRIIRAFKNRFGAVNEIGIFAMTDRGLRPINNPSAIFLSRSKTPIPGSIVMATWEGSRPMLIEIQALVTESHLANPRRVVLGFDPNRLALMLAVLYRHGGIVTYNQDVFINVVGGVRVTETGIDLPVLLAVMSSLKNQPLSREMIVFGEVGLSGEIRPVQSGQERIKEAYKLGFTKAIIPVNNAPAKSNTFEKMEITPVNHIKEALRI